MLVEELGADDELGGHELALRPQRLLVDEHLPAALLHQAGGPRLGHPRALQLVLLEGVERGRVVLRLDGHVSAARRVGLDAVRLEPRAQGHVLGVTELRRGDGLTLQVGGRVDVGLHHQRGAPRSGAGDDPEGLALRLGVAVDGGVRADVGGVDGAGEQRLDGGRPGVVRRRLQLDVGPELVGEDALVHAHQRGGVGDVGEVAEAQGDLVARRRAGGRGRGGRVGGTAGAARARVVTAAGRRGKGDGEGERQQAADGHGGTSERGRWGGTRGRGEGDTGGFSTKPVRF